MKEGLEEAQVQCETSVLQMKQKHGINNNLFDACENSEKGVDVKQE